MDPRSDRLTYRPARSGEREACIAIWQHARAERDGRRIEPLPDSARAKFDQGVSWLVAESTAGLAGFVLCTGPRNDLPADLHDAPVVAMLAVAPDHQGVGAGRGLLGHALGELARQGHRHAVLYVFADNTAAVRLYESTGWRRTGDEAMIDPLGKRPSWIFSYPLNGSENLND